MVLTKKIFAKIFAFFVVSKIKKSYANAAQIQINTLQNLINYAKKTKFGIEGSSSGKRSYLHLVKKDEAQILRIERMSHYSTIFSQKNVVYIDRIYVPRETKNHDERHNLMEVKLMKLAFQNPIQMLFILLMMLIFLNSSQSFITKIKSYLFLIFISFSKLKKELLKFFTRGS